MKESEIKAMNRSFGILNERRIKIMDTPQTQELQEKVIQIREHSISNLDELLQKGIKTLEANGMEVILAENSEEALQAVYDIVKDEKMVAKSKSNTAGEIGLSEFLKTHDVEVLETDLGDRIVQFDPESRPSHPIGPASHLRMVDIARIVSRELEMEVEPEPRSILNSVKADVLEKLGKCRVGITGANSVAAEDGAVVTVHNEGNISLVSMLDTHIILAGIDKLVETVEEAVSVVKLETIYATGKRVPAYMNVVSSPSKTADIEQIHLRGMYGPNRVVVILIDNGRSEALEDGGECLLCIGCGSCVATCPVYSVMGNEFGYRRHLGGKGVFLSQFIEDESVCYDSGLFYCTLCGLCTVECPLGIETNHLMENTRKKLVKKGISNVKHCEIKDNIKKTGSPF
ncbi:LUD domain-containing protein [Methanobacterium aggregans]|uniref:LUD domain-containing protein n=1 Tax=Methanobacterium aggregans TaxID=1615586 RepID=UPI001AE94DB3|nr:LUD domain-containing protein [Methanobacterium aggregans]MBP2045064.1 L-lactate utilization protein LutB [Methanobacterium aggregans]